MILTAPLAGRRCSGDALRRRPLPRVLYAIAMDGSQKFGSLEEQIFFLARAFRAESSLLLPLFLAPSGPSRAGTAAFDAAELPTASLDLHQFRWKALGRLTDLIDRHSIQLVHWNFYPPVANSYVWWLTALRPRVKHYFTDHNSRLLPPAGAARGLGLLVKRALLKRYRKVWCVSRFVQDCLTQQQGWSNLACCRHFINTHRFRPDAKVRRALRRDQGCEDAFVVLAVANLIREKGIDVALRAVAELPRSVFLWIVGSGSEEVSLQSLRDALGLQRRATFFGQQAHVQPYMQAADCLACPSLWAEAAGLVNLEALSTGLPVLASRIGGIPEYVDDGQTGFLFPPGDHNALAALIQRLHDAPGECRRLGETARATAVRRFSVSSKIDEYLALYRMFT
jgi:glycosyltransferase involved in cell wall biosynthesis